MDTTLTRMKAICDELIAFYEKEGKWGFVEELGYLKASYHWGPVPCAIGYFDKEKTLYHTQTGVMAFTPEQWEMILKAMGLPNSRVTRTFVYWLQDSHDCLDTIPEQQRLEYFKNHCEQLLQEIERI